LSSEADSSSAAEHSTIAYSVKEDSGRETNHDNSYYNNAFDQIFIHQSNLVKSQEMLNALLNEEAHHAQEASRVQESSSSGPSQSSSSRPNIAAAVINSSSGKASTGDGSFCICGRGFVGKMVACDKADCVVEWYHFDCVGLLAEVSISLTSSWRHSFFNQFCCISQQELGFVQLAEERVSLNLIYGCSLVILKEWSSLKWILPKSIQRRGEHHRAMLMHLMKTQDHPCEQSPVVEGFLAV
jgi:hypothetical protein